MEHRLILDCKIDKWFDDRGITANGTPLGQAIKTLEETTEILDAINKDDVRALMDAIGDTYVTLRGICKTADIPMERCIYLAYTEIKDRTGYLTEQGVFVKDR